MSDDIDNNKYGSIKHLTKSDTPLASEMNDAEIEEVLKNLEKRVDIFEKVYKRKIPLFATAKLNRAASERKNIIRLINSFKSILCINYVKGLILNKGSFYKDVFKKVKLLSARLVFFSIEMNSLSNIIKKKLKFIRLLSLIKVGYYILVADVKALLSVLQVLFIIIGTILLMHSLIKLSPAFIEFIRKLLIVLNTGNL